MNLGGNTADLHAALYSFHDHQLSLGQPNGMRSALTLLTVVRWLGTNRPLGSKGDSQPTSIN